MYSILLKQNNGSYLYATNTDGSVYSGNLSATQAKITELMGKYPLGSLVVVHNTTLTAAIDISDVIEE
jgi:uncharacterized membrane protein